MLISNQVKMEKKAIELRNKKVEACCCWFGLAKPGSKRASGRLCNVTQPHQNWGAVWTDHQARHRETRAQIDENKTKINLAAPRTVPE